MKISYLSVLFIVVLIFLIFGSTSMSCTTYRPFSKEMMYAGDYPQSIEGFKTSEYSTYPEHQSVDILGDNLIHHSRNHCEKVNGFNGLVCSPDSYQNPNDIFSEAKGSDDCKASGYTNSRGNLCMDDLQLKLLTSRGGNATGIYNY
jgi:hypothetical protein